MDYINDILGFNDKYHLDEKLISITISTLDFIFNLFIRIFPEMFRSPAEASNGPNKSFFSKGI
jgi:hypothetical protein